MLINLKSAMELAPDQVRTDRQIWPAGIYDEAVNHHIKLRLIADVSTGLTRNRQGWQSQFTNYDWASNYEDNAGHIYYDFFRGAVMNSASRIQRGLAP